MGDAALGHGLRGAGRSAPRWLVVRNASDPQINGNLPTSPDVQAMWAVWFYEQYGYWTSLSSAIACWGHNRGRRISMTRPKHDDFLAQLAPAGRHQRARPTTVGTPARLQGPALAPAAARCPGSADRARGPRDARAGHRPRRRHRGHHLPGSPPTPCPWPTDGASCCRGCWTCATTPTSTCSPPGAAARSSPNRYDWSRTAGSTQELIKVPNRRHGRHADHRASTAAVRRGCRRRSSAASTAIQGDERFRRHHRAYWSATSTASSSAPIELAPSSTCPAKVDGFGWETFAAVLKAIDEARVDAFYVHLAEGQRDDDVSASEFAKLKGSVVCCPRPSSSTARHSPRAQLGELADVGGKLVWSPREQPAPLPRDHRHQRRSRRAGPGVPRRRLDALGLHEPARGDAGRGQRDAPPGHRGHLPAAGGMVTSSRSRHRRPRRATSDASQVGRPADLVVLRGSPRRLRVGACSPSPTQVDLVMIGGDVTYARADWLDQLAPAATSPSPATGHRLGQADGPRQRLIDGVPTTSRCPPSTICGRDLVHAFPPGRTRLAA